MDRNGTGVRSRYNNFFAFSPVNGQLVPGLATSVLSPALSRAKQACMYVPMYMAMESRRGAERRVCVCERARPLANEPLNNVAPMTATRPEGT